VLVLSQVDKKTSDLVSANILRDGDSFGELALIND